MSMNILYGLNFIDIPKIVEIHVMRQTTYPGIISQEYLVLLLSENNVTSAIQHMMVSFMPSIYYRRNRNQSGLFNREGL